MQRLFCALQRSQDANISADLRSVTTAVEGEPFKVGLPRLLHRIRFYGHGSVHSECENTDQNLLSHLDLFPLLETLWVRRLWYKTLYHCATEPKPPKCIFITVDREKLKSLLGTEEQERKETQTS